MHMPSLQQTHDPSIPSSSRAARPSSLDIWFSQFAFCLSASYLSLRDDWIEVVCIIWMGYDNQCYPMMGELFMERGYEIGCG
jgi:hypothetical protein